MHDLLDLRQAFAAGVHFLLHQPASAVQIECGLRAAYCAMVVRRRSSIENRLAFWRRSARELSRLPQ
jgi:hypothetical protein